LRNEKVKVPRIHSLLGSLLWRMSILLEGFALRDYTVLWAALLFSDKLR
jgi:hypothetical protein